MSRAKEIIDKITYVTIATSDNNGQPWNTPVFAAYDQDFNFYWGSSKNSQHSKNIEHNPNVFLVVFDSSAASSEGEGVYVKASALEVSDQREVELAYNLLKARDPHFVDYWQLRDLEGDGPVRIYKATPEKIWMNDGQRTDGIYEDILKEAELS